MKKERKTKKIRKIERFKGERKETDQYAARAIWRGNGVCIGMGKADGGCKEG